MQQESADVTEMEKENGVQQGKKKKSIIQRPLLFMYHISVVASAGGLSCCTQICFPIAVLSTETHIHA